MNPFFAKSVVLVALVLAASGCRCGGGLTQRYPSIEERETTIDFGQVQLDVEHQHTLVLYNGGAAALNIHTLEVDAPFGVVEEPPFFVDIGQELALTVTFLPTVKDKREVGSLRITSDDPERTTVRISLAGTGVQAVAVAEPSPLDFGEVWVGEHKSLTLRIRNQGTHELTVVDATFLDETPDSVSGDLSPLREPIPAGGHTEATLRFAPTAMRESLPGGIRLELLQEQGGELLVPFAGRGIRAVPRLCFKPEGSGLETCTDPNASMGVGNTLNVTLPPICDATVSPPDAGFDACEGAPYNLTGDFYVKNEGNAPVRYNMEYRAAGMSSACDGGPPLLPDFQFSNAPSPATLTWKEGESAPFIGLDPMDESGHVDVTYNATSNCISEASDQALVIWTRQGDARQPNTMLATFSGQSKLPSAQKDDRNFFEVELVPTTPQDFYGAVNAGIAPFAVTGVEFWQWVKPTPAESCLPPNPDDPLFISCAGFETDPNSWCSYWAWAPGDGDPMSRPLEQRVVPPAMGGESSRRIIGQVVFVPNNEPPSQQTVCVYARVETTDPYRPVIFSRLAGSTKLAP